MPIPDLTLKPDTRGGDPNGKSTIFAVGTGVPVNGNNTFGLPFVANGIPPDQIDENWLSVRPQALGPSVTGATFVSLSPDKQSMTLSVVQGGGDQILVEVGLMHTLTS